MISGLVVYLRSSDIDADSVISTLADHPKVTVGEPVEQRLPIVVDADDEQDSRRMWDWLNALPGVNYVTVAYVHPAGPEEDLDASQPA